MTSSHTGRSEQFTKLVPQELVEHGDEDVPRIARTGSAGVRFQAVRSLA
jgi:hypothetical protein